MISKPNVFEIPRSTNIIKKVGKMDVDDQATKKKGEADYSALDADLAKFSQLCKVRI